jgi:hypothetical protein
MNVSRQFLKDFAFIANRYGWTAADIDEVKESTRADPKRMCLYWATLAAAHRAGYEQTPENGYMRLHTWCVLTLPKFRWQQVFTYEKSSEPESDLNEAGSLGVEL